MKVEERLKELIIQKYGTMKDFTEHIGIPNSTFANIMRRGVQNANVVTIIKICQALEISTDDLAEGKIVSVSKNPPEPTRIEDVVQSLKQLIMNGGNLTLDGLPVTEFEILQLVNGIDAAVEVVIRNRRYSVYLDGIKKDEKQ